VYYRNHKAFGVTKQDRKSSLFQLTALQASRHLPKWGFPLDVIVIGSYMSVVEELREASHPTHVVRPRKCNRKELGDVRYQVINRKKSKRKTTREHGYAQDEPVI
jgi:hypothetical protein